MTDEPTNNDNDRTRRDILFKSVVTTLPIAIAIAALDNRQMAVFGLFVLAALPWVPMYRWRTHPNYQYALASALSLTLVVAMTLYLHTNQVHNATPGSSTQISLTAAAKQLKFLPVSGPIPHCVSFSGTGTVPAGYSLVLFDRPADADGHYTSDSTFSYDDTAMTSRNGWSANELDIGSGTPEDDGTHIAIVTILVSRPVAEFLADLTDQSDSGQLPHDVTALGLQADQIVVVRNGENKHC